MEEKIKNGDHKLLWLKIEHLEKFLNNHIVSRLDKLNGRLWKLMFSLLAILGTLSVALVLALVK